MPGGDRTGPRGQGPLTGRGRGWCRGAGEGGSPGGYYGQPRAFGSGRGRGWRHCYYATGLPGWARAGRGRFGGVGYSPWAPQDELNYLKDYTQGLEEALNSTRMRMAELEKAQRVE
jgi:hypothetical protein